MRSKYDSSSLQASSKLCLNAGQEKRRRLRCFGTEHTGHLSDGLTKWAHTVKHAGGNCVSTGDDRWANGLLSNNLNPRSYTVLSLQILKNNNPHTYVFPKQTLSVLSNHGQNNIWQNEKNLSLTEVNAALFTPGINICLGLSDHKRSAEKHSCLHLVVTSISNVPPVTNCDGNLLREWSIYITCYVTTCWFTSLFLLVFLSYSLVWQQVFHQFVLVSETAQRVHAFKHIWVDVLGGG